MTQNNAGLEYVEQSYFPRWKARLIMRFSEFGLFGQLQTKVPSRPTRSLYGVELARGALAVVADPNVAGRYNIQAPGGLPGGNTFNPQAREQSSDGFTQVLEGIVPIDFKWAQNGLRTASSLNITIPFLACPIDPRTLRACAIEFYMGTITAAQAQQQATAGGGGQTGDTNPGAESLILIPETYTDTHGQPRTNLR